MQVYSKLGRLTTLVFALLVIVIVFRYWLDEDARRTISPQARTPPLTVELLSIERITDFAYRGKEYEKLIAITIAVENRTSRSQVYNGWNDGAFGYGAQLIDNLGNRYRRVQFGARLHGSCSVPTDVAPKARISDRLFFVDKIEGESSSEMTLTLRSSAPKSTTLLIGEALREEEIGGRSQ